MKPSRMMKIMVPAYWPIVEGVQEVEKSGSVVVAWKVMTPIEWADEDMSSVCADVEDSAETVECRVKSAMGAVRPSLSLSLCRGRRK